MAHAQNSIYYFMTVVIRATFGLLAVAAFLESSSMLTANRKRAETVIFVKGDDLLSRLHA